MPTERIVCTEPLPFSKEGFVKNVQYLLSITNDELTEDTLIVVLRNLDVYVLKNSAYELNILDEVNLYGVKIGDIRRELVESLEFNITEMSEINGTVVKLYVLLFGALRFIGDSELSGIKEDSKVRKIMSDLLITYELSGVHKSTSYLYRDIEPPKVEEAEDAEEDNEVILIEHKGY